MSSVLDSECLVCLQSYQDARFDEMTYEQWTGAVQPKVAGSWNLHNLLPADMDFFVLLSSAAGVIGSHGQSNYVAGNTYEDTLARHLTAAGRRCTSIDLGVSDFAGWVAEREGLAKILVRQGIRTMGQSEFNSIMDYYCSRSIPIKGRDDSQVVVGLYTPGDMKALQLEEPPWMRRAMFSLLHQIPSDQSSKNSNVEKQVDYATKIRSLTSVEQVAREISNALRLKVAKTLAIDPEDIDIDKPLQSYGADSLVAMELRNWCKRALGVTIQVFALMGNTSIEKLGEKMVTQCEFISDEVRAAALQ
jgi:acyl carrier protein